MVMVDGCEAMADVHDRMPTILSPENWSCWTDGTPEEAFALCRVLAGAACGKSHCGTVVQRTGCYFCHRRASPRLTRYSPASLPFTDSVAKVLPYRSTPIRWIIGEPVARNARSWSLLSMPFATSHQEGFADAERRTWLFALQRGEPANSGASILARRTRSPSQRRTVSPS